MSAQNRVRALAGAGTVAALLALGLTTAPSAPAAQAEPVRAVPAGAVPAPAAGTSAAGAEAQAVRAPAGSPVAINGQLKVCGTKLCNQFGKPIQLRGMSTHGIGWFPRCYTDGSLDALATDWKADVLRVSMYVDAADKGYLEDPVKYTNQVHSLIEKASARGMYVIVDWHMLGSDTVDLGDGDPWTYVAHAKRFFKDIAERHKDKNNLLYEIANEPNGKNHVGQRVDWWTIKTYAEDIIPYIRQYDADTPVLVGTPDWASFGLSGGSDENEVVNNPLRIANIMYTFHFYAASHREWYFDGLTRVADKLPVFVSEFGTQNYLGEGANDFAMTQRYLDLMASKKISWVNWNFSDDHRSGAVFKEGTCNAGGPWTGTAPLKEAGAWIRGKIRTADNFPTS
ncbi:glycoside hydrolase family 5 protein [Streptomyces jumonjinensis]|uniref:cellulase n=1 Tax=Streptomyces jumonjinensis TaxID=1945 RepID=A0A646KK89_STRJU|nr:glycoside hydrolase family 5 protein [Streptomyces jumonjinensis]MQT02643.1 glycoside hydrolase family 5 protein [Streptomyces jumonjinensis]